MDKGIDLSFRIDNQDDFDKNLITVDVYGKPPLIGLGNTIQSAKNVKTNYSLIQKAIKQIMYSNKLKYSQIRKVKGKQYARPFYTSWIIPIMEIIMSDLDLKIMEQTQANEREIFNVFGVPKKYMGKEII